MTAGRLARSAAGLVLAAVVVVAGGPARAAPPADWVWPVAPPRIVGPYVQPAHTYAPGHRGIDLAAAIGAAVRAPARGVVAFVGRVVDRGIVTIDHGDGFVTTFEPVVPVVDAGDPVIAGQVVAVVDVGGHTSPGAVHFGVRQDGAYINPMLLLGGIPRAILLPCC